MQRRLTAPLKRLADLAPEDGLRPLIRQGVLASAKGIYSGPRLPRNKTSVV